ncbi:MAG: tRNA pseudouridine(38-40) synthase TruA [Bacteroidales bacterium]|nr:tRNA pseudouridine(38-40) synthase TruA [Bacteroidales bacterium]
MRRYKLTIQYIGTRYHGWQMQRDKNTRTIQGAIANAAKEVNTKSPISVYGSGRTDSGVHALAQVAHLDFDTKLTPKMLQRALNDNLPSDINIINCELVDSNFHARKDATQRSYVYLVARHRTAFGKPYVWWVKEHLNIEAMRKAAKEMVGLKNFQSFTDPDAETTSTMVNLTVVDILETPDLIVIHLVGSHFLWKMVRRIVGTLVEVGKGALTANDINSFLQHPSEIPSTLTAPSSGLFLQHIYYNNEPIERGNDVIPFGGRL